MKIPERGHLIVECCVLVREVKYISSNEVLKVSSVLYCLGRQLMNHSPSKNFILNILYIGEICT